MAPHPPLTCDLIVRLIAAPQERAYALQISNLGSRDSTRNKHAAKEPTHTYTQHQKRGRTFRPALLLLSQAGINHSRPEHVRDFQTTYI